MFDHNPKLAYGKLNDKRLFLKAEYDISKYGRSQQTF